MLDTLPFDKSDKFNRFKSMFKDIPDSILLDLSKLNYLSYIVDSPMFTRTYIYEGQVINEHLSCQTVQISSILNYEGCQLYVLYQINYLHSGCYLRGAFVDDHDNIRAKDRDNKIDILLDEYR